MKKLLALALTLVTTLSLASPAFAAEEVDEYAAYEAAHPEEIAALDAEKLISDWGYEDINMTAQEQFMEYAAEEGESLAEAVKREYIGWRLLVEENCRLAEERRALYPELWASFDAEAYFADAKPYGAEDKAVYMAEYCILTQEEFVDDMFVEYCSEGDYGDDPLPDEWWEDDDLTAGEPTLTLYVNGVASDIAVEAWDGRSYANGLELRTIFPDCVDPLADGPVSIRDTAQLAGWDIAWFDGGWRGNDQEIQLWDKAKYEAELADQFGPANDFFAKVMKQSMGLIFSETPISGHETVDIELKRFSTLDENKEYTLKLGVDYVAQKGVVDMTLTFDVSQLLQLIDPRDLAGWAKEGGFTVAQLTSLLKAGTVELILDYNENAMAYNIPLLALFDEDEAGWQTVYSGTSVLLPDMSELSDITFANSLYAQMTTTAGYMGAEYAAGNYEKTTAALTLFLGKDRFHVQNGKTTYSMTTQGMNRAVGELISQAAGLEKAPETSVFKYCDLTYTLDDSGNIAMDLHFRPDVEGIRKAIAAQDDDDYTYGMATLMGWYLPAVDMDITATGHGNQGRYVSAMSVHWNNVGTMEMRATATSGTALSGPRQIGDV